MDKSYERRWLILVVQSIAILAIILSSSTISIALPSIQKSLSATMSDLQWMMNAYMLSFASLMLLAGWLGDRLGRKVVFLAGLGIFAAANALAFLVTKPYELILLRGFMGMGAAMLLPITLAILTDVFPEEERGKAIGVWAGMNSIGIALGPIVGGALVQNYDWRSIFWVNLPVAAAAIVAAIFLIPNKKGSAKGGLDVVGTLSSAAGLALLVYGLTRSGTEGWGDAVVLACIGTALFLLLFFVVWERRRREPLFDLSFFRLRIFSVSVACLAFMSLGLVGITFALSLYMQFVAGFSPLDAGYRLLPLAIGIFFGAGSSNRIVKKVGSRPVIVAGFLGTTAASVLFAFLKAEVPYSVFGPVLFLLSFFLGYVAAPATTGLMASLPKERASTGSAMNSVVRTVAGAIGVAVLGAILSSVYADRFAQALGAGGDGAKALALLPEAAKLAAGESVGAAIRIAERLPEPLRAGLSGLARESFMAGWNVVAWISAALNAAGAAIAFALLPRGQGKAAPAEGKRENHG